MKTKTSKSYIALILLFLNYCLAICWANPIVTPSVDGLTISFELNNLKVQSASASGKTEQDLSGYKQITYGQSPTTGRLSVAGNPQLPVSRFIIGVPVSSNPTIDVTQVTTKRQYGIQVLPTPHREVVINQSNDSLKNEKILNHYREDGLAYQSTANYPRKLAEIVYDGYIRSQRVIYLELHPIQYNPSSQTLLTHSRLVVRLRFDHSLSKPSSIRFDSTPSTTSDQGQFGTFSNVLEPNVFERLFEHNLINAEQARQWRRQEKQAGIESEAELAQTGKKRYKICVSQTGIYQLREVDLRTRWQIDLRQIDPRLFQLHHKGKNGLEQIPIYVKGEKDGHFSSDEYITFLGKKTKNRYTRWNVYWLSIGKSAGLRVAEIDASPTNPGATQIPAFRAKKYFEEDHLHSNLQHLTPDSVVPSRSEQNYSNSRLLLNQSYGSVVDTSQKNRWFESVESWFWTGVRNSGDFNQIDLDFPLFDLAKSFDPPQIEVELQGGTPTDHQALVSVNDIRIDFASWKNQDSFRVSRSLRLWNNLKDAGKGEMNAITLARVDTTTEDNTTRYPYHMYINSFSVEFTRLFKAVNEFIDFSTPSSDKSYEVRSRRKVEYQLESFLSPSIEIFEHDGSRLVAKLSNVHVKEDQMNVADQNRLRQIEAVTEYGLIDQQIPEIDYTATFQVSDAHDGNYMAVSSRGIKHPDRIEIVAPSDLLDVTNGADYIIIAHPTYISEAKRLANWRQTNRGGNYRVKVADLTEIYDTFGQGFVSPKAIKSFLKYAYQSWQPPSVSYVVLMGDGTWDFRGFDTETHVEPPETVGYIPTHYIWTSQFGQTSTDHWYTTVSGIDELPDFYLGRLSVESIDQAQDIVDKIIGYESNRPNGKWRKQIVSVADDEVSNSGDFIFRQSLNEIASGHTLLGYETTKIFLEDVIKEVKSDPAKYNNELPRRVAKDRVIEALGQGSVIAQYAGHGGRVVWAHEAIFDNTSIDQLAETKHQPFMLVLSCYNGYFDKPGEPSMAEKLLRHRNGGIISMLSATRLTYGSGNDALNRIIFDSIFKRNVRNFGSLSYDSKVELLATEGTGQIDVMLAYTLFGDPAMQLAIADYETQPRLANRTTAPGEILKVEGGQIFRIDYDAKKRQKNYYPLKDFNGRLEARAVFPGTYRTAQTEDGVIEVYNGDIVSKVSTSVTDGRYDSFQITVPTDVRKGTAHLEVYAESLQHIAVGGISFSIKVPRIVEIKPKLVSETTFQISALISDELTRGKKTGVETVTLEWRHPTTRDWSSAKMIADDSQGRGWYKTEIPLPLAKNTEPIRYQIVATDIDGLQTTSDLQQYRPYTLPDLSPIDVSFDVGALIYQVYSAKGGWELRADIQQSEDFQIQQDIKVVFFSGNPDRDDDGMIDQSVKKIGQTVIPPVTWKTRKEHTIEMGESINSPLAITKDPLNLNQIATASIRYQLPIGEQVIFVWVNPPNDEQQSEVSYSNNIAAKHLEHKDLQVGQKDINFSPAGYAFSLRLPRASFGHTSILRLDSLPNPPPMQPSLKSIPLGGDNDSALAYNFLLEKPETSSSSVNLISPVTIELYFDWTALKAEQEKMIGLEEGEIPDQSQLEIIKAGAKQVAGQVRVYRWLSDMGKWLQLAESPGQSTEVTQFETLATNVRSENKGDGHIKTVRLDANASVREGKWVLFFTGSDTYRLYLGQKEDDEKFDSLELIDNSLIIPSDLTENTVYRYGMDTKIIKGNIPFQFGDILNFEVLKYKLTGQNEMRHYASAIRRSNNGNGVLRLLASKKQIPPDSWIVLFLTEQTFQVEGKSSGLLATRGQLDEVYQDSNTGLSFEITSGLDIFDTGDSFLFQTREIGRVQAETSALGTFALMHSSDRTNPDIQLTVGRQNFVSGDPVSDTPLIQATISDDNGINPESIKLEIGQNNRNFRQLTDVEISQQYGANQVLVNYQSEELKQGVYQIQLFAKDLDGNRSETKIEFQVNKGLQLLKVLNYPNPFNSETDITYELPSSADEVIVSVYTISGRLIWRREASGVVGFDWVRWDGRDSDGRMVANGVYYCKVIARSEGEEERSEIIKLMKLR